MRALGSLVAVAMLAAPAFADGDAATLRTEGEDFARRGLYAEAIVRFKAADKLEPRAQHACMIGLAYLRRDGWAQAELFLARCKQRSRSGEPLPEWIGDAERQLAEGLAKANVTTVTIVVKPATAASSVSVSGFAPDETFDPQTMHLPAGAYTLTITSAGHAPVERKLTLAGTHDTVEVIVDLEAPMHVEPVLPPKHLGNSLSEPTGPRVGNWLLAIGGFLAVSGGLNHIVASKTRTKLNEATTDEEFRKSETMFDVTRVVAISSYGVAAAAIGIGLYLRLREPDRDTQLVGAIGSDGAYVGVEWRR